tara:strand:+ start:316 stop:489 length:174 start_codon:yes stop_codon:yes gene_type:complete
MSRRKKIMLLSKGITQEDIDEAVELKSLIEDAMAPVSPEISFETLLLWWLTSEPAEA